MRRNDAHYLAIGRAVWAYYRQRAMSYNSRRMRAGILPKLYREHVPCAYCGRSADIWEHRDYTDPLTVVPACNSCNLRVGPSALDPDLVVHHLRWSDNFPFSAKAKRIQRQAYYSKATYEIGEKAIKDAETKADAIRAALRAPPTKRAIRLPLFDDE